MTVARTSCPHDALRTRRHFPECLAPPRNGSSSFEGNSRGSAYVGGQGWRNLGDDALFEAARQVLGGMRLVTFRYPRREERLSLLGLSGRGYFQQFVLGGGTFINPYGLSTVRAALQQGLPAWTLGTGVGSAGLACAAGRS